MKKFPAALIFAIAASKLSALSVDEEEVKSKSAVNFINSPDQTGKDTVAAIRGIGKKMAEDGRYGSYSVIHATGAGDKFDADIVVLGASARVNHIKNIRRILAAYLSEKYEYSDEDARSLALFITYYNGFYRKNMGYFKENYKPAVLKHISAANAGLDRSYKGWAGKSRIVIPLSADDKPDAGKIGEKEVMEKVRKEEKGTKDRENINKLQEKEIKKKEDRLGKERERIDRRKDDIAKREDRIKEERRKNEDNPDPKERASKEEDLKRKEDNLNKEKTEVKKEEDKLAKEEKKVEEKKSEIAENKQNVQDDKAKSERKNETPDQREARLDAKEREQKENRPQDNIFGGKLYYLRVRDFSTDGKYRNDFYIIDPKNRKVRVKSPYGGIVGKKFDMVDKDVVVIGEKRTSTNVQHFLVLLDGDTLADKAYGADEVFWRGFVEVRDNEIYAVLNKSGTFYLGKFDKNLKLLMRSEVALHEDTFFSFFEDTIYVNGADRKIEVLNKADLKSVGNLVP